MITLALKYDEVIDIVRALDMRINFIQTGNVLLSAGDVAERNDPKMRIKNLDVAQMGVVMNLIHLRDTLSIAAHRDPLPTNDPAA
jgi:hypothetical protein